MILTGVANWDLTGNNSANILTGNGGNNVITGLGGNDVIDGGYGFDRMVGGDGDDTYVISEESDEIVEAANGGNDTVYAEFVSIDLSRYANVEQAILQGSGGFGLIGNNLANTLIGNSGNNHMIGNEQNDILTGNDGDDILDGGFGKDVMTGGLGNDTYYVTTLGDQVIEQANQGTDHVITYINYTLGSNVENLSFTGNANIKGTGNVLNNVLTGNAGNNVLLGGGGRDTLFGGDGNDTLNGGTNVDVMVGGQGDDIYYVNLTGDQVVESANQGIDTVHSEVDYVLYDNVEHLVLDGSNHIHALGNILDNHITGNRGNNVINGDLGNNLLMGGAGNDSYRLNRDFGTNTVVEAAAAGTDTVQFGLGVLREQVWLSRVDDDLVVQIIGTNANVVVQDWYSGGANVEQFRLLSGRTLMAADVDTLVNAMAALTPPAFGETTLSTATKNALGTVFFDTWHTIT